MHGGPGGGTRHHTAAVVDGVEGVGGFGLEVGVHGPPLASSGKPDGGGCLQRGDEGIGIGDFGIAGMQYGDGTKGLRAQVVGDGLQLGGGFVFERSGHVDQVAVFAAAEFDEAVDDIAGQRTSSVDDEMAFGSGGAGGRWQGQGQDRGEAQE